MRSCHEKRILKTIECKILALKDSLENIKLLQSNQLLNLFDFSKIYFPWKQWDFFKTKVFDWMELPSGMIRVFNDV